MIVFGSDYRTPPGPRRAGHQRAAAARGRLGGDRGRRGRPALPGRCRHRVDRGGGGRRRHVPRARAPRRWRRSSARRSCRLRPADHRPDRRRITAERVVPPDHAERRHPHDAELRPRLRARGAVGRGPSAVERRRRGASRRRVSHTFGVAEPAFRATTALRSWASDRSPWSRRSRSSRGPSSRSEARTGSAIRRCPSSPSTSCWTSCWSGSRRRWASTRWRSCCSTRRRTSWWRGRPRESRRRSSRGCGSRSAGASQAASRASGWRSSSPTSTTPTSSTRSCARSGSARCSASP